MLQGNGDSSWGKVHSCKFAGATLFSSEILQSRTWRFCFSSLEKILVVKLFQKRFENCSRVNSCSRTLIKNQNNMILGKSVCFY
jgi:hypothetical protein